MQEAFWCGWMLMKGNSRLTWDSPYALMVLAAGGAIAIGYIIFARAQVRKNEMLRAGQEMGFMVAEHDDDSLGADVPLFGHGGQNENALKGNWGKFECQVLDYDYREGKAHSSQTVAIFRKQGMNLPAFEIRPAHFGDGLMRAMSRERVKFPENPDFEQHYMVHSVTPIEAKEFFGPAMQEYFTGLSEHPWTMEASGDEIVMYRRGKIVRPMELREFVEKTGIVAEGMAANRR